MTDCNRCERIDSNRAPRVAIAARFHGWPAIARLHTTLVRNAQHQATLFDVAELAGVSIKTVSRVVNSEPNVRPVTQERVEGAIATLNYLPNEAARRLVHRRGQKNA